MGQFLPLQKLKTYLYTKFLENYLSGWHLDL